MHRQYLSLAFTLTVDAVANAAITLVAGLLSYSLLLSFIKTGARAPGKYATIHMKGACMGTLQAGSIALRVYPLTCGVAVSTVCSKTSKVKAGSGAVRFKA